MQMKLTLGVVVQECTIYSNSEKARYLAISTVNLNNYQYRIPVSTMLEKDSEGKRKFKDLIWFITVQVVINFTFSEPQLHVSFAIVAG